MSIYVSNKAAMMSYTRSMAAGFVRDGIRVNAIAPGPVDTDMMRNNPQRAIDGMVGGTLMKRLARPDEMVGAALLLCSDAGSYITGTVVIVDGEVLAKPANPAQAAEFMQRLSGRTHEVRTAVALAIQGPLLSATSVSTVTFRRLEAAEIKNYCATSEPYDKAGGYGIQGLAAVFIERIEGSYTGVMGLPLFETAQLLSQAGMRVL
jgi:MAF protein